MNKKHILTIDDEPDFAAVLKDFFEVRGFDVDVALRGVSGIQTIKDKCPDIILMDLKMPGIDGDEVFNHIKKNYPNAKVIFITAYDDGGKTKARLLKMGAYAYFDKPLASLDGLLETVKKATA